MKFIERLLLQLPVNRHLRLIYKSQSTNPMYPISSAAIAPKNTTAKASISNSAKSAIITGSLASK